MLAAVYHLPPSELRDLTWRELHQYLAQAQVWARPWLGPPPAES
jgi:hypothetical protein